MLCGGCCVVDLLCGVVGGGLLCGGFCGVVGVVLCGCCSVVWWM